MSWVDDPEYIGTFWYEDAKAILEDELAFREEEQQLLEYMPHYGIVYGEYLEIAEEMLTLERECEAMKTRKRKESGLRYGTWDAEDDAALKTLKRRYQRVQKRTYAELRELEIEPE